MTEQLWPDDTLDAVQAALRARGVPNSGGVTLDVLAVLADHAVPRAAVLSAIAKAEARQTYPAVIRELLALAGGNQ